MKKLLVSLSVLAVSAVFASASFAAPPTVGGCQAFGQATANGAPWGQETKNQNENGAPGIIASNNFGAHTTFCSAP